MRYFKCFDCGHIWTIIFWEDGIGTKMACPECKSLLVHQIEKVHGWDRKGDYTIPVKDEDIHPQVSGREPVRSHSLDTENNSAQWKLDTIFYQRYLYGIIRRFGKHSP